MKKFTALLIAVMLTVGLMAAIPLSVYADGPAEGDIIQITTSAGVVSYYSDVTAALTALANGDTLKLLKDVSAAATVAVAKENITFTIDGDGKTLTATGSGFALSFTTPGCTVNLTKLNLVAANGGITFTALTADTAATVNMTNVTIDANKGNGIQTLSYWNVNIDNSTIVASSHGMNTPSGSVYDIFNIKNSSITGEGSYGIYFRKNSSLTAENVTINSNKNAGIQMVTGDADNNSVTTLKNCTITSTEGYCVISNAYNKVYIDGGTYKASTKDACINIGGTGAFGEIKSGTFESDQNCVVRAYRNATEGTALAQLDIYGGTFTYTSADGTGAGSAIRGGTGDYGGIVNIYGGTFITNGAGPVANKVHADGQVNIVAGTFTNAGTNDIKVYDYVGAENFTDAISFPEGQKTLTIVAPETTTAPSGDETTAAPVDETTAAPVDETTAAPDDETTAAPVDETTAAPVAPTTTTGDDDKKGCGGITVLAQFIAVICGAGAFMFIKKK